MTMKMLQQDSHTRKKVFLLYGFRMIKKYIKSDLKSVSSSYQSCVLTWSFSSCAALFNLCHGPQTRLSLKDIQKRKHAFHYFPIS